MSLRCRDGETAKDESKNEIPNVAPFELLHKYQSQLKRFRQGNIIKQVVDDSESDTVRPNPDLPHGKFDLARPLLDAARRISARQYDCAEKLLEKCCMLSATSEDPMERVAKFFAEALRLRVEIERGKIDLERRISPLEESVLTYQSAIIACESKLPSSQVTQFTTVQTILDSVGSGQRIHLVDFSIKSGLHWSIMMQGLANRVAPIDLLKITAIGASKERLQETGKRLTSFAESMKLPFLFKSVVSENEHDLELNPDWIKIEPNESVAVYLGLHLWAKLAWPSHLASFVQFLKKLDPCVIVVNEIEANTNNSIFVERFREALSFTMAMFDYIDTCLRDDVAHRMIIENVFFQDMIRNIIAAEDEERTHRHARVGFWRGFFGKFNIVEKELSACSLYQARLLIERKDIWKSCSLQMDGKSLIVGWKGTPLQSISAWEILDDGVEHDHEFSSR